jgi:hypothetical protein
MPMLPYQTTSASVFDLVYQQATPLLRVSHGFVSSTMLALRRCVDSLVTSSRGASRRARITTTRAAVSYLLTSERDTEDLACLHAESREVGDAYLLSGPIGAGKSTFWC